MALGKQELEHLRLLINKKIESERVSTLFSIMSVIFLFLTVSVFFEWDTTSFFLYLTLLVGSTSYAYKCHQEALEIKSEIMGKMFK